MLVMLGACVCWKGCQDWKWEVPLVTAFSFVIVFCVRFIITMLKPFGLIRSGCKCD